MRLVALLVLAALAGCSAPVDPPGTSPSPDAAPGPVTTLALDDCGACYEPTVAWDPAGRLYVASGGGQQFAVSNDSGRTYVELAVPEMPDGQQIAGDVLVQIDPAGRLWWSDLASLGNNRLTFRVARSDDGGLTWPVNSILPTALDPLGVSEAADRQWLAFDGDVVYAVCTCPLVAAPRISRSDDGGATWSAWTDIATAPGRPSPVSLPLAYDGRVVVAYFTGAAAFAADDARAFGVSVSVSGDGGATFQTREVYAAGGPDVACCAFPSLARGSDGRLAIAWAMKNGPVYIATSEDDGDTWSEPIAYGEGGRYPPPSIVALPDGRFAVTWFADGGDGVEARLAVATPEDAAAATPRAEVLASSARANTDFSFMVASPAGDRVAAPVWVEDGIEVAVRRVADLT